MSDVTRYPDTLVRGRQVDLAVKRGDSAHKFTHAGAQVIVGPHGKTLSAILPDGVTWSCAVNDGEKLFELEDALLNLNNPDEMRELLVRWSATASGPAKQNGDVSATATNTPPVAASVPAPATTDTTVPAPVPQRVPVTRTIDADGHESVAFDETRVPLRLPPGAEIKGEETTNAPTSDENVDKTNAPLAATGESNTSDERKETAAPKRKRQQAKPVETAAQDDEIAPNMPPLTPRKRGWLDGASGANVSFGHVGGQLAHVGEAGGTSFRRAQGSMELQAEEKRGDEFTVTFNSCTHVSDTDPKCCENGNCAHIKSAKAFVSRDVAFLSKFAEKGTILMRERDELAKTWGIPLSTRLTSVRQLFEPELKRSYTAQLASPSKGSFHVRDNMLGARYLVTPDGCNCGGAKTCKHYEYVSGQDIMSLALTSQGEAANVSGLVKADSQWQKLPGVNAEDVKKARERLGVRDPHELAIDATEGEITVRGTLFSDYFDVYEDVDHYKVDADFNCSCNKPGCAHARVVLAQLREKANALSHATLFDDDYRVIHDALREHYTLGMRHDQLPIETVKALPVAGSWIDLLPGNILRPKGANLLSVTSDGEGTYWVVDKTTNSTYIITARACECGTYAASREPHNCAHLDRIRLYIREQYVYAEELYTKCEMALARVRESEKQSGSHTSRPGRYARKGSSFLSGFFADFKSTGEKGPAKQSFSSRSGMNVAAALLGGAASLVRFGKGGINVRRKIEAERALEHAKATRSHWQEERKTFVLSGRSGAVSTVATTNHQQFSNRPRAKRRPPMRHNP